MRICVYVFSCLKKSAEKHTLRHLKTNAQPSRCFNAKNGNIAKRGFFSVKRRTFGKTETREILCHESFSKNMCWRFTRLLYSQILGQQCWILRAGQTSHNPTPPPTVQLLSIGSYLAYSQPMPIREQVPIFQKKI